MVVPTAEVSAEFDLPTAGLSTGSDDCPCINATSILALFPSCITKNKEMGAIVTSGWSAAPGEDIPCYPLTYGSSHCMQHDLSAPSCQNNDDNSSTLLPAFCYESFCFVDYDKCKDSKEIFRKSDLFNTDSLYYSYSTCNSTDEHWSDYATTRRVRDKSITVTFPEIWKPAHYKVNPDGSYEGINVEEEYHNNSNPWKGWVIDYLEEVLEISDIAEFKYTHRSGGSSVAVNHSDWTASVYDVHTGVSCLAASFYWITTERLQMTTFTTPLTTDKIFLWIKNPYVDGGNTLFSHDMRKIFEPFHYTVWWAIIGTILIASILSVWFTTEKNLGRRYWLQHLRRETNKENASIYDKTIAIFTVLYDSVLESSIAALTQSVEFEITSSISRKIFNVGFAFLIMIMTAAYTANLAAYLAISGENKVDYVQNMEDVIANNVPICGPIQLKIELETSWPDARWTFADYSTTGMDERLFDKYDNELCSVIVYGINDALMAESVMTDLCDRNIVRTNYVVLEKPVAFPVCTEFAAGISYWLYEAHRRGISFEAYQEESKPPQPQNCRLSINEVKNDNNDIDSELLQLTLSDFAFPLFFFGLCCVTAIIFRLHRCYNKKRDSNFTTKATKMKKQQSMMTKPAVLAVANDKQCNGSNSDEILRKLINIQKTQNDTIEELVNSYKKPKDETIIIDWAKEDLSI